jgi:hypothetical protein
VAVIFVHESGQNEQLYKGQTTQWPKEKVQKDKQRSTKHTYKTKDRVTRTQQKTGGELIHVNNLERGFVEHLADPAI